MTELPPHGCNPIIISYEGCPRCWSEGGHGDLEFYELAHPMELESEPAVTHWASCPTLGEPILMSVLAVEKDDE